MLRYLLLSAVLCTLAAEDSRMDLFALGLSYHTQRKPDGEPYNGFNPGLGAAPTLELDRGWETFVVAMAYRDSEKDQAIGVFPGIRCVWEDRFSLDAEAGILSCPSFTKLAAFWTAGVRIAPHTWVHGSFIPQYFTKDTGVALAFLRFTL